MKILHFLLFAITLGLFSCTEDTGSVTVTYQEATAIYGDMDQIRGLELNLPADQISNPGKVYIGDDFILIGEEEKGIHVIDNSDSTNPNLVSFIQIPGNREYYVEGQFLYAESYYDVIKIDISNPLSVQIVSRLKNAIQEPFIDATGKSLIGFSYEEKTKTVDENSKFYEEIIANQIVYIDFAQNVIPKSALPSSFAGNSNQQSGTVNRITRAKDHIYIINNFRIIVLDDQAEDLLPVINNSTFVGDGLETIFPYNDKLFVGSRSAMNIFDLANADSPQEIYQFDHATSCDPVLPVENVAYITLRTADFSDCPGNINALIVLDIEDLQSPQELHEIQMNSPYGMSVIKNRLYIGEGENGLSIFDVTDKNNPVFIKTYTDISAFDIIAHPTRNDLILLAGPNGLDQYIIDDSSLDFDFQSSINY